MRLNRALLLCALVAGALCLMVLGSAVSALAADARAPLAHDPILAQVAGASSLRMLLPLIFIGILVYLMVRHFQRSRMGDRDNDRNQDPNQQMSRDERHQRDREAFRRRYSKEDDPENLKDAYSRARASWDWLSQGGQGNQDMQAGPAVPVPDTPAGFDVQEFLAGAKAAYVRIRQALAENEAQEALDFAEQDALDQIMAMAKPRADGTTELPSEFLLVNARLMDTATVDGKTTATVFYDSLARSASAEEATQLREVWRFQRRDADKNSNWKLASVEPMDQDPAPA